jgi:hypothetical protein
MYKLYFFEPEHVQVEGYAHAGSFDTEQECNDEAFAQGHNFFRIEFVSDFGSSLVFESALP